MRKFSVFTLACAALMCVSGVFAQYQPTTEKGKAQLKEDYLFQCDFAPTFEKAKAEIGYARAAAERIAKLPGAPDFKAQLAALDELEKKIDAECMKIKASVRK